MQQYIPMSKECKFGEKCWNKLSCKFAHSETKNIVQVPCRFGQKCRNLPHCRFYHTSVNVFQQQVFVGSQLKANNDDRFETMSEPDPKNRELRMEGAQYQRQNWGIKTQQLSNHSGVFYQSSVSYLSSNQQISSSQNSKQDSEATKIEYNSLNLIYKQQQQYLQTILQQFFNVRLVKYKKFQTIFTYVSQNLSLENVPVLVQHIQKLQQSTLAPHFTYLKLVKTIIKKNLNYDNVCEQLEKQLKIKLIKQQKHSQFLQEIKEPIQYEVLTDSQLLDLKQEKNKSKIIFLVDGDNVMNSHKIFRKYYRKKDRQTVAEGQVRLRWLLSQTGNCFLFFDYEKLNEEQYDQIADKIMYKADIEQYQSQSWQFANIYEKSEDEEYEQQGEIKVDQCEENIKNANLNQQNMAKSEGEQEEDQEDDTEDFDFDETKLTADKLILKWISENDKSKLQKKPEEQMNKVKDEKNKCVQDQNLNIVLVTGDRVLIQKALQQQKKLVISSGKYFIKYCKQSIRRKYYGNKNKKSVIKRIFIEPKI